MLLKLITIYKCCFAAGLRLRYPSSYVLLLRDIDCDLMKVHSMLFANSSSSSTGTASVGAAGLEFDLPSSKPIHGSPSPVKPQLERKLDCNGVNAKVASRLIEKTWQDGTVNSGIFLHGYVVILVIIIKSYDVFVIIWSYCSRVLVKLHCNEIWQSLFSLQGVTNVTVAVAVNGL